MENIQQQAADIASRLSVPKKSCFPFHKWSRWTDPETVCIESLGMKMEVTRQHRWCFNCNKHQMHLPPVV